MRGCEEGGSAPDAVGGPHGVGREEREKRGRGGGEEKAKVRPDRKRGRRRLSERGFRYLSLGVYRDLQSPSSRFFSGTKQTAEERKKRGRRENRGQAADNHRERSSVR
eukprot:scaffold214730_cov31-Tisochrysis_lutea.AAC.3